MESNSTDLEKLKAYSSVTNSQAAVAELLKASHIREPRGEFAIVCPGADACVKMARTARSGARAAARAVLRTFLPPATGDPSVLVDAVVSGQLVGGANFSVTTLTDPSKPKEWLGLKASSDSSAKSRSAQLSVLLRALPLISCALAMMHPEDSSVHLTMMDVMAVVARGVASRSAEESLSGVLVPLFRAYGEAFDKFQKSSSVQLPTLAAVWERERAAPTLSLIHI